MFKRILPFVLPFFMTACADMPVTHATGMSCCHSCTCCKEHCCDHGDCCKGGQCSCCGDMQMSAGKKPVMCMPRDGGHSVKK